MTEGSEHRDWIGLFLFGSFWLSIFFLYAWLYGDWVHNPKNSPFQNARLLPGFLGLGYLLFSLAVIVHMDIFVNLRLRKKIESQGRMRYVCRLFLEGIGLILLQILMDKFIPFTQFM